MRFPLEDTNARAGRRGRLRPERRAGRGAARRRGDQGAVEEAATTFVFGGFATVQFDLPRLAATASPSNGAEAEADGAGGLRYRVIDGKTTLKFPLKSVIKTVGNVGLEQTATGRDLNFTDFPSGSAPPSPCSRGDGLEHRLRRPSPDAPGHLAHGCERGREGTPGVNNVPMAAAAGAAAWNAQFATGLPVPPFAAGQVVGVLNVSTRWYNPTRRGSQVVG